MKIEVSIGEALDKLSILELKKDNIKNIISQEEVMKEYEYLFDLLKSYMHTEYYLSLKYINLKIWKLLDETRTPDIHSLEYVRKCTEVIEYNDARYRIKNHLNHLYEDSNFKEQKSYSKTTLTYKIDNNILDEEKLVIDCLKRLYQTIVFSNIS